MRVGALEYVISVEINETVTELYDISNGINEIIELVPERKRHEALEKRDKIVNKLLDWVDASEK